MIDDDHVAIGHIPTGHDNYPTSSSVKFQATFITALPHSLQFIYFIDKPYLHGPYTISLIRGDECRVSKQVFMQG